MIGFGAGSSYFDANVQVTDADTGQALGEVLVDQNSWPLGGVLASEQTVDGFMLGAAMKVASELSKAKSGTSQSK